MTICIVGAGAIGGWLAAKLSLSGVQVSLVARGAAAAAIRQDGLLLKERQSETITRSINVIENLEELDRCDTVILAVKAHQIAGVSDATARLARAGASVVTLQNGLPWWYFQGSESEHTALKSVDPDAKIAQTIPEQTIIGGIVYVASETTAPGSVSVQGKGRIVLGEPTNRPSMRIDALVEMFSLAGISAEAVTDIRQHLWAKLWRNAVFNPLSCLTGAGLADIASDPLTSVIVREALQEVACIAQGVGIRISETPDEVIAMTVRHGGAHKTSMLQDLLRGRTLELGAIVGSVIELADRLQIPAPHLRTLLACATQRSTLGSITRATSIEEGKPQP